MKRLAGEVALITGSSRNIGKAIALAFAGEGANLILNTRVNRDELEMAASECRALGIITLTVLADVSDPNDVERMVGIGLDHFGKIDLLVSNAAIRPHKSILEITIEEWHRVIAVNLDASFYLCKAILPSMIERRHGNIIAIGGSGGFTGRPNQPAVAASKGGLQGLIKGIAVDYGGYGIRANLIIPGPMRTERRYPEWYPELKIEKPGLAPDRKEGIPLKRSGDPEELARVALFLASNDSSYVTGQHIMCDGGLVT